MYRDLIKCSKEQVSPGYICAKQRNANRLIIHRPVLQIERCAPRKEAMVRQLRTYLVLTEPSLEPTLPLLARIRICLVRRLAQGILRRRIGCPACRSGPARTRRWWRRSWVAVTIPVGTPTVIRVAVFSLGTLILPLLLQSLLLQLVHGVVERTRVCRLTVGIGVSGAGTRHGGYIVVGPLIALLLIGMLCVSAISVVSALVRHARVVARSTLSVLSVWVVVGVLGLA